jgi:putative serine/threonine protein kinase
MKASVTVPVQELNAEPYASVVCYPRVTPDEIQSRLQELKELGVESVEFSGKGAAFTLPVLGKGYVGIVVVAHMGPAKYALKIQRVDSDRESLERESGMLAKANSVGVGPKLVGVTKHLLLMELVDGDFLEKWLEKHRTPDFVRKVLSDILEQCWRLDEIGLDHGELSKAPKHLLMNKTDEPFIVDFETASTNRNASNVTSVCQFLFQGNSNVCRTIAEVLGQKDRDKLIRVLKCYKKERNRINFEAVLAVCLA